MNRNQKYRHIDRRSFLPRLLQLESLEPRQMLTTAPLAVDDQFSVAEDTTLSTAEVIFSADFEGQGVSKVINFGDWDYLDTLENGNASNDTYPTDGIGFPWNIPIFDSSTSTPSVGVWKSGPGPLSAGTIDGFTTQTSLGGTTGDPNTVTTYLFRNTFTLTANEAATLTAGTSNFLCDDSCVVYLNGSLLFRQNLPASFDTNTTASNSIDETQYINREDDLSGLLFEGENTIAIEIHQHSDTSSDAGLDYQLTLSSGAVAGIQGFVYADDAFNGTSASGNADGSFVTGQGNPGNALLVDIGRGNFFTQVETSGGWSRTFSLPEAAVVSVILDYRLIFSGDYENTEFGEAILEVDGTSYGNALNDSLAHFVGNGNGGSASDTGWQSGNFQISLSAGNHTLTVGAYNNHSSSNSESVQALFDNIIITPVGNAQANSVLFNDTDAEVDPLTAVLVNGPTNGDIALSSDGTFTYIPDKNFNGVDFFTYLANDGDQDSNIATVTLTVTSVNDVPIARTDQYHGLINTTLNIPAFNGVLVNDSDVEDDSLQAMLDSDVSNGSLTLNTDGSFSYTPNSSFTGLDSFTYHVNDTFDDSSTVTVQLNVTSANALPVANDDSYSVDENQSLVIDQAILLPTSERVFFADFDGATQLPAEISGAGIIESVQGYDTLSNPENPANVFSGNLLRNSDSNNPQNPTVLTLTDLPEHNSIDLNFLLAMIDSWDGNSGGGSSDLFGIVVDGITIFAETFDTADINDQSYSHPVDPMADGLNLGFNQSTAFFVDSAYDMSLNPIFQNIPHTSSTLTVAWIALGDGWSGGSDESWGIDNLEVIVNREAGLLVPTGSAWKYLDNGSNQQAAWVQPSFNDSQWELGAAQLGYGDGDEATTVGFGPDSNNKFATTYFRHQFTVENVTEITSLSLDLLRDDGAAVYLNGTRVVLNNLAEGAAFDDFAINSTPGGQESTFFNFAIDPALLVEGDNTLAVEIHQAGPTSSDISFDLKLSAIRPAIFGVLNNDLDDDGDPLTATLVTGPSNGSLTFNADGTFSYTPDLNFQDTDSFTYRASDPFADGNIATVNINVIPGPNDAPVAGADNYNIAEDGSLVVNAALGVLKNDTDAELEPLTAIIATLPSDGSLSLNTDGSFTYTPNPDFFGIDTFTYTAFDGSDSSSPATVTITVVGSEDNPQAVNDFYFIEGSTTLDVLVSSGVLTNDIEPDNQTITAQLISTTANGNLQLLSNGSFQYTPNPGFSDTDTFTYRAIDINTNQSNLATVSITVNTIPVANDDVYFVDEDNTLNVSISQGLLDNDSDADSDPLTVILVAGPSSGILQLNQNGSLVYVPNSNFFGVDTFTYRAFDGDQQSNIAEVTINVAAINDAPLAVGDQYTSFADSQLSVNVADGILDNDSDVDSVSIQAVLDVDVSNGTLVLSNDGSFTYTPNPGFIGDDFFTYHATDGFDNSTSIVVTIEVVPAPFEIVINEIMYHPQHDVATDIENTNEEYIELFNNGLTAVDLSGWQFTSGVQFTIPNVAAATLQPGEFLVIAADLATFAATYPGVTNVVAGWIGRLSNSTEEIELTEPAGNRIDRVTYADQGDWAVRRRGLNDNGHQGWVWEALHDGDGRSLELITPNLSNRQGQNWSSSNANGGTPGVANSVAASDVAPLIQDVIHSPAIPTPTDSVTITAKIVDELATGTSATLFYRVADLNPGAFISTAMFDDGLHGDGEAGDRVFGVILPPQSNLTVIEFYVTASDGALSRSYPTPSDTLGNHEANLLYQVDALGFSGQPIFRTIMTGLEDNEFQNINRQSDAQMNATFISIDGTGVEIRYNAGVRIRGAGSRSRTPPNNRINIPRDNLFKGESRFNINSQFHWLQLLGTTLFRLSELPAEMSTAVNYFQNGVTHADTGGTPQFGSFVYLQVPNSNYVEQFFPDEQNGNLYKKVRPDVKWDFQNGDISQYINDGWSKSTNSSANDWSDLDNFMLVINNAAGASYLDQIKQIIDIDQWVQWFAAMTILTNHETNLSNGTDDDYLIFFGENDQRARLIPHDFDTIFGVGDTSSDPTASIFPFIDSGFAGQSFPQLIPLFDQPEVIQKYYQALIKLLDTTFSPEQLNPLVDNLLGSYMPANEINAIKNFADARRTFILSQIPDQFVVNHNASVQNGIPTTTNPSGVVISGTTPSVTTSKILINNQEVSFSPIDGTWSTADNMANSDLFLAAGSSWFYLDTGIDQLTAWRASGFDDSGWLPGNAELGYGENDEATLVSFGSDANNKFPTTYFRTTFNATNVGQYSSLTVNLKRDDGAAVYLNGVRLVTDNLAVDALYADFATDSASDDGDTFTNYSVPASALVEGVNTLAVEIHQIVGNSSDISFDLELLGNIGVPEVLTFNPGINHFNITVLDENDTTIHSQSLEIFYDDGSTQSIAGTISTNTTLTAAAGPYLVTGDLIINASATLTIQPGTTLFFADGTGIVVNGRLDSQGTIDQPIYMTRTLGSSDTWDGIQFNNTNQDNRLTYVNISFGDQRNNTLSIQDSTVTIDHARFSDTTQNVITVNNSSFTISNSTFPATNGNPTILGSGIATGGVAAIDGNTFAAISGEVDVIHFTGGQRPGVILQILNNTFLGSGDDLVQLIDADAHVEGNRFASANKNNLGNTLAAAIAAEGNLTEITLVRNIFDGNDYAVLLTNGAALTSSNNVFANGQIAAINFDEPGVATSAGLGATMQSEIFYQNSASFENVNGGTVLTVDLSLLPQAELGLGTGNFAGDPRFVDPDNGNFDLTAGSIAPPNISSGVILSAVPLLQTPSTQTNITVGGAGILSYRFSLDGAAFGSETSLSTPLQLTGLLEAEHTLRVIGKSSAGIWQEEAEAVTFTWTVDSASSPIRISEVIASNIAGFQFNGQFTDLIEFYNDSPLPVDLDGLQLTDELDTPDKHIFAAGTIVPAFGYLTLIADGSSSFGHLNFSLNKSGDEVYLFQAAAIAGDTPIDKIEFGLQISDASIGLMPDGTWALNIPTFGSANRRRSTATPSTLVINEWLTDGDLLFKDDRFEIYNPDIAPVALGGLYVSDNPVGQPDKHQISALSFIAGSFIEGSGYTVFQADGSADKGAGHVDFKLAAHQDMLGLFDSELNVIDMVPLVPQTTDVSQGRTTDGSPLYSTFATPTFGLPNDSITIDVIGLLNSLRITELMYHPANPTAAEIAAGFNVDDDEFEFIELKNIGTTPLELTGVEFTNGIEFTFGFTMLGAGDYLLVVKNQAAFEARYGTGLPIAGEFESGKLSNSSENIELSLPSGFEAKILDFTYQDSWFPTTDGDGPSLVIVDETAETSAWKVASGWRASGLAFGSPGTDDPLDGIPPSVIQVNVSGTTWQAGFLDHLNSQGFGTDGFAIPILGSPSQNIPWNNLNQITLIFDETVSISQSALVLKDSFDTVIPIDSFNVTATTATWTYSAVLSSDRYTMTLDTSVTDLAGNALATEFIADLDILTGDVNSDDQADATDLSSVITHMFSVAGNPRYDILHDLDGDGLIGLHDLLSSRNSRGDSLPPSSSPSAAQAAAALVVDISKANTPDSITQPIESRNRQIDLAINDLSAELGFDISRLHRTPRRVESRTRRFQSDKSQQTSNSQTSVDEKNHPIDDHANQLTHLANRWTPRYRARKSSRVDAAQSSLSKLIQQFDSGQDIE